MVNQEIRQLADRLSRLELHAAHSGREVLRVLIDNLISSQDPTTTSLMQSQYENIRCLLQALPPYAPPLNSINRLLLLIEDAIDDGIGVEELKRQLDQLRKGSGDAKVNWEAMLLHLVKELPESAVVYTHTLSETVLGVLTELHQIGKLKLVNVTESRPNYDGWDTARRLAEIGVNAHLYIDAAMPAAIEHSHLMLTGAEIINQDGSVVGKVGTYPAAVLCQLYAKPVFIVADTNKINPFQRGVFHLTPLTAHHMGMEITLPRLHISGAIFDLTPAHLIHAYATELGVVAADKIPALIAHRRVSKWLANELCARAQDKYEEGKKEE